MMEAYKEKGETEKFFRCVACYEEYETLKRQTNVARIQNDKVLFGQALLQAKI